MGVQVKIGSVTLGEDPGTNHPANPNPIKIDWSRENRIKNHDIPAPADKTIRTSANWAPGSGGGLYTCRMNFRTIPKNGQPPQKFNDLLDMCEKAPLVYVITGTRPSPLWMYIKEYQFNQTQGYDDDYIEWNITLLEARD
jgi:hypothetical protein